MVKVHFLDETFELECTTALQVERWLDTQGYLEKIKDQGLYFQGLSFDEDPQELSDIMKYRTNVEGKEVWSLIFDLNYDDEDLEAIDDAGGGGTGSESSTHAASEVQLTDYETNGVAAEHGANIATPSQSDDSDCWQTSSRVSHDIETADSDRAWDKHRYRNVNSQQKNCQRESFSENRQTSPSSTKETKSVSNKKNGQDSRCTQDNTLNTKVRKQFFASSGRMSRIVLKAPSPYR